MMKSVFRLLSFLSLTFLFVLQTVLPSDEKYDFKEVEAAGTLPLFSTEVYETGVEPIPETIQEPADYGAYGPDSMVPCTSGLLVYYNQGDPRWADSLYGPSDRMGSHGCGPTALAMIVSSFTGQKVTPLDIGQWAANNGYCSRGEGSRHALIPDGLTYYGLSATSLADRSVESVLNEIRSGKIVIALMNRGYFTNGGHFLLLTQVTENGTIRIADPASWENTCKEWDPAFILDQVRSSAEAGGPLWVADVLEN